jgi:hypothetical protein
MSGGVGSRRSDSTINVGRRLLGGGGRLVISKACGQDDEGASSRPKAGDIICTEPSWWSSAVGRIDGGLLGRDKMLGGFADKELELMRIRICLLLGREDGGGGERPIGRKSISLLKSEAIVDVENTENARVPAEHSGEFSTLSSTRANSSRDIMTCGVYSETDRTGLPGTEASSQKDDDGLVFVVFIQGL